MWRLAAPYLTFQSRIELYESLAWTVLQWFGLRKEFIYNFCSVYHDAALSNLCVFFCFFFYLGFWRHSLVQPPLNYCKADFCAVRSSQYVGKSHYGSWRGLIIKHEKKWKHFSDDPRRKQTPPRQQVFTCIPSYKRRKRREKMTRSSVGIARIFQGVGGGGHTVSNTGFVCIKKRHPRTPPPTSYALEGVINLNRGFNYTWVNWFVS